MSPPERRPRRVQPRQPAVHRLLRADCSRLSAICRQPLMPGRAFLEREVLLGAIDVDANRIAFAELPAEDLARQRVFDPLLDPALQWPGAEGCIVTLLGEQFLGFVADLQLDVSL